ncbi:hypothetical protein MPTK1_3g06670 [Marchantia polymorpha subsp. ruderalis]|uniref:F-box domain-containing protein n=2 Tax=Marchantia polymorpha TaxID=3197 RepID=A0AAF6AY34_MARPO|nr:hypothetical protein MARPO_0006s0135 [Marchantia polymorpha]BBN04668.1 hypothetical protein Mp_3g06670 [Marchantia polymorpha subsp. ruderalis]|eukprot:PTQ48105.1 hypothetical protein MARPO_0006s0135 [Marchantia polymorpha]
MAREEETGRTAPTDHGAGEKSQRDKEVSCYSSVAPSKYRRTSSTRIIQKGKRMKPRDTGIFKKGCSNPQIQDLYDDVLAHVLMFLPRSQMDAPKHVCKQWWTIMISSEWRRQRRTVLEIPDWSNVETLSK